MWMLLEPEVAKMTRLVAKITETCQKTLTHLNVSRLSLYKEQGEFLLSALASYKDLKLQYLNLGQNREWWSHGDSCKEPSFA